MVKKIKKAVSKKNEAQRKKSKTVIAKKTLKTKKASPIARASKRKIDLKSSKKAKTKSYIKAAAKVIVESTKFWAGADHVKAGVADSQLKSDNLPAGYSKDEIVLMVRDTHWLHAYWEVRKSTWDGLIRQYGRDFYDSARVLRVYDVTGIDFSNSKANSYFDVVINEFATNWYLDVGLAGKSWCVDLGILLRSGRFITIVRSNIVTTPLDRPSDIIDEDWMVPDELSKYLYDKRTGFGWSSGNISSPGGFPATFLKQDNP